MTGLSASFVLCILWTHVLLTCSNGDGYFERKITPDVSPTRLLDSTSYTKFDLNIESENPYHLVTDRSLRFKEKQRNVTKRLFWRFVNPNRKVSLKSVLTISSFSNADILQKKDNMVNARQPQKNDDSVTSVLDIDGSITTPQYLAVGLQQRQYEPTTTITEFITVTDTSTTTSTTTETMTETSTLFSITTSVGTTTVTLTTTTCTAPCSTLVSNTLTSLIAIIATAVVVPTGLIALTCNSSPIDPFEPIGLIIQTFPPPSFPATPFNALEIPVPGQNLTSDGCRRSSVLFITIQTANKIQVSVSNEKQLDTGEPNEIENGTCFPLLSRGPCRNPRYWVTLDPNTLQGRCTPRLCGRGRVFVERDGLCHDIYDPGECSGGRRLYYSAFGDPVCDCPLGQYPFPSTTSGCVTLFQQGPCSQGNVIKFANNGKLECAPTECASNQNPSKSFVRAGETGLCHELGTVGPCRSTDQLLGFDVFLLRPTCVDISDPSSPYFSSAEEDTLLDSVFNPISDDNNERIYSQDSGNHSAERKQGINTFGSFRVPTSLPNNLLNPCRPGAQNGYNTKCTNPVISERRMPNVSPLVRPAFGCPSQTRLQATGQCRRPF